MLAALALPGLLLPPPLAIAGRYADGSTTNDIDQLVARCRECEYVVVGRLVAVHSFEPRVLDVPGLRTRATATLRVIRHLKGDPGVGTVEVEFRYPSRTDVRPDEADAIWCVRGKLPNGRHLVSDRRRGADWVWTFEDAISRVDRKTRYPGMPKPEPGGKALSAVLAVRDADGAPGPSARIAAGAGLRLAVQFENHAAGARAVMPCLDGSSRRRQYPYYELEVVDAAGGHVPRAQTRPRCGNTEPLGRWDVVPLDEGEVFRTSASADGYDRLPPGKYRVRLRYTASRDRRMSLVPLGPDDPVAVEALKSVWEGELVSNWVDVEVTNARP